MKRFKQELPEIRYMLDRLPTVARKVMDNLEKETEVEPQKPDRQSMIQWAQRRYLAFTGALALIAGVLLLGQQADPDWLGWALGGVSVVLLWAGRPR